MGGEAGREGSEVYAYSEEYGDVFLPEGVEWVVGVGV